MSSLAQAPIDRVTNESTSIALKDTLLTPRFYTCLLYTSPSPRD